MQLTRLQFLGSLLGLSVGSKALARTGPRAVTRHAPTPLDGALFYEVFGLATLDFLRLFIQHSGIEVENPPVSYLAKPRQARHQIGVDLRFDPEKRWTRWELSTKCLAPAAAALADVLRNEYARGARGLSFLGLSHPAPLFANVTSYRLQCPQTGYCVRGIKGEYHDPVEYESYTLVRFDARYAWRKEPLRRKHPFLRFDPARLPA